MDLLKGLTSGASENKSNQGYGQQSHDQKSHDQKSYDQQPYWQQPHGQQPYGQHHHQQPSYGQQQGHPPPGSGSGSGLGGMIGGLIGGNQQQPQHQQQQPSSGSGLGAMIGGFTGGQKQQEQQKPSGWGNKLNSMMGGGPESEKKEDALDKAVDLFQEHVLKQGPQNNESAFEQAKDEHISDFIRNKYKGLTGKDVPIKDK